MNREKIEKYAEEKAKSSISYFEISNQVYGILSISLGLSCLGTENPVLFSGFCNIFITILWGISFRKLRYDLEELDYMGHPSMAPMNMLINMMPAMMGWLFLFCIINGLITSKGLSFYP